MDVTYKPRKGLLVDFGIIAGPDGYHLFYDHAIPEDPKQSHKHLGHAFSKDLVSWSEQQHALYTVEGTWEGLRLYSPFIICHRALYYMFYVGVSENRIGRVGCAVSSDLWSWTKFVDNPVWEPGYTSWANWYRGVPHENRKGSCRDIAILFIRGDYLMYYTAHRKDHRPCVAACETSDDLFNWYDRGPVLTRELSLEGTGETESPHVVFKPEFDKYYLFFNHGAGIKCVWSSNPLDFNVSEEIMFLKGCAGFEYLGGAGKHEYFAYFTNPEHVFHIGELKWRKEKPEFCRVEDLKALKQFARRKGNAKSPFDSWRKAVGLGKEPFPPCQSVGLSQKIQDNRESSAKE